MSRTPKIAIVGAGPVGMVSALLLAKQHPIPSQITLFQEQSKSNKPDPRTLALNYGSEKLLRQLNAWPTQGGEIKTVHVSQRHRLGITRIDHKEFNVPRLGTVIQYQTLLDLLQQQIQQSGITLSQGGRALIQEQHPHHVRIAQDEASNNFDLAIQAEGGIFSQQTRQTISRHYDQWAIITNVEASHPKPGVAWERFTRDGPLALLPHPTHPRAYALVWCLPYDKSQALIASSEAHFTQQLADDFGQRLGTFKLLDPRVCFELGMNFRTQLVQQRLVTIGNAAQTLHPVTGQGLNLGLRDAAELALSLKPLVHQNYDLDQLLFNFQQKRRRDRRLTLAVTDNLPRLFVTQQPLIEHTCGLGLVGLDQHPRLKKTLAHQLLYGTRV